MIKAREYDVVWVEGAAPLDLKRIAAELARAIAKDGAKLAKEEQKKERRKKAA